MQMLQKKIHIATHIASHIHIVTVADKVLILDSLDSLTIR